MLKAVLFDLDGIITDTAKYHYIAWKQVASEVGIEIDEGFNENLKGVDRVISFDRILAHGNITMSEADKEMYRTRKNDHYVELLQSLTKTDILPGIEQLLIDLQAAGIKIVIASISQNAQFILEKLELMDYVTAIADPRAVAHSKPAPDIFLEAMRLADAQQTECIGVEDAQAGVDAIVSAGIYAVGVGDLQHANKTLKSTEELTIELLKSLI